MRFVFDTSIVDPAARELGRDGETTPVEPPPEKRLPRQAGDSFAS
jgi:hypothetical protein